MAEHDMHRHVEVHDDDRTVAAAEVTTSGGSGGTVRASLRAEAGHITPGRRASLVDAVLDLPEVRESARLEAAFPLGDSESLHRLQERCEDVSTRPAGGSVLLDASLPPSGRAGGTGGPGGPGGAGGPGGLGGPGGVGAAGRPGSALPESGGEASPGNRPAATG